MMLQTPKLPERIICMTEETTETLYLLGASDRIVGISGYTMRPREARKQKPKISAFTSAKIDKILDLNPDLVIGFSDMQADIAADLIRRGVNVLIYNQRSVQEILNMMLSLSAIVGEREKGEALVGEIQAELLRLQAASAEWPTRPRVYFEEWDDPQIQAIQWVSELIGIAGGDDCFPDISLHKGGRERIIDDPKQVIDANPDIIVGSWCGKRFRPEKVAARPGWDKITAVKNQDLYEIKSVDILQPGPAALGDGMRQLHQIFADWIQRQNP